MQTHERPRYSSKHDHRIRLARHTISAQALACILHHHMELPTLVESAVRLHYIGMRAS
eukprot:CAMPEP_0119332996 /NCGR_PEP_ID=MMETSP1333-20130426/84076_1 /TAXON_ID=418940 /ORGANISM="Scyphosphaera apsteinii, Strain RCC1455" /LENGTH=57 /DNA_ID=CAMNT_0007342935 /DNA_START=1185 /DNA_END=1358 /DNA_ORIENTATION=-